MRPGVLLFTSIGGWPIHRYFFGEGKGITFLFFFFFFVVLLVWYRGWLKRHRLVVLV